MVRSFLARLPNSLIGVVLLVPCLLICLACATPGEKFQLASLPRQGQAHVYVYHTKDPGSFDIGHRAIISLDGEEVGTLRTPFRFRRESGCQYLLLSVSPGDHQIQAQSKIYFGLNANKPRKKTFTAEPDRVYFVRLRRIETPVYQITHTNFVWISDFSQLTEGYPPPDITQCEVTNSSAG
jgi:hypothetical protein